MLESSARIAHIMRMRRSLILLLLHLVFSCSSVFAEAAASGTSNVVLSTHDSFWAVTEIHLSLADSLPNDAEPSAVVSGEFAMYFGPSESPVPIFDGKGMTMWGRVTLENPRDVPLAVNALIRYAFFERIDWFWRDPDGGLRTQAMGQQVPATSHAPPGRFPLVELLIDPGETRDLYFRVRSDTLVVMPLRIYERGRWVASETLDFLVLGVFIGCLFTMFLVGSLFYMTFRRAAFLWFSAYCLVSIAYSAYSSGIGKVYLWPTATFPLLQPLWLIMGIGLIINVLFVATFMGTRQHAPRYHRLLVSIAAVSCLVFFNSVLPDWLSGLVFVIATGLGPLAILSGALVLWLRGVSGAGLIAISWIPYQLGLMWAYLRSFDLVPYFDGNHYTMPLTSTLTALAFMWALHRQSSKAEHEATHDQLTNLPNRTLFDRQISRPNQQSGRSVGVMQVDLDGFKGINDNHGHAAGDFVLQIVADRLRNVCGSNADAFRTGGDEFIVLCHRRTRKEDVEALANSIVDAVSKSIDYQGDVLTVGASVGVAYPLEARDSILSAIDEADAALYEAKARGKGQVATAASFGEPVFNRRSTDRGSAS
ncbi:MAG: diguanylate cyclase [Pseudomonadota bacterium]